MKQACQLNPRNSTRQGQQHDARGDDGFAVRIADLGGHSRDHHAYSALGQAGHGLRDTFGLR